MQHLLQAAVEYSVLQFYLAFFTILRDAKPVLPGAIF